MIKITSRLRALLSATMIAALMGAPVLVNADATDDLVSRGVNSTKAGAASQKKIDKLSEDTEKIVGQYHQQRKVVEGLRTHNDRMRRTLTAQENAMATLEQSIEDASLIERQIVPLMLRMISGLEKFVASDIPFKKVEREERLERITGYLNNANISAAERFRQVLQAYKIESGYGNSIDVYTDDIELDTGSLSVNVLQVGRVGLYYQTFDGARSGYWDKESKNWRELDSSANPGILKAIRILQEKEIEDLVELPIDAPQPARYEG